MHYEQAFDQICKEAHVPETWYVCLVSSYQRYGGPEEGGWYQTMDTLEKYAVFPSFDLAEAARAKIFDLAKELTWFARITHGEYCQRQLDWLEERGLDASFFPEDDGETKYRVITVDEMPEYSQEIMRYE